MEHGGLCLPTFFCIDINMNINSQPPIKERRMLWVVSDAQHLVGPNKHHTTNSNIFCIIQGNPVKGLKGEQETAKTRASIELSPHHTYSFQWVNTCTLENNIVRHKSRRSHCAACTFHVYMQMCVSTPCTLYIHSEAPFNLCKHLKFTFT